MIDGSESLQLSITSFMINLYVYEYINSQNEPLRKQLSTTCVEKYGVKKVIVICASEYGITITITFHPWMILCETRASSL